MKGATETKETENKIKSITNAPRNVKAGKTNTALPQKPENETSAALPAKKKRALALALPEIRIKQGGENGSLVLVRSSVDRWLLLFIITLICFGSVMVFSASYADAQARYGDSFHFIKKQIIYSILGFGVMAAVSRMPDRWFRFWAVPSYIFTIGLLLLVLVVGMSKGVAQRWINIFGVSFQPSELAKITLVLMLSWYMTRYKNYVCDPVSRKNRFIYGIVIPCGIIACPVVLVAAESHLSGTIIIGLIGILVMFCAGSSIWWMLLMALVGGGGVAAIALFTDYTKERLLIWENPWAYPLEGGWQTIQGLLAIGSGGLFGLGLGNSRQKYSYVSQPQNDFIFTIVCEELGFIGALAVLALFIAFIWRIIYVAKKKAKDNFSMLVCIGIAIKMAIQVLLNTAVVTNTIPNTGISLPFFSYGGSSLLMLFLEMGILLSISRYSYEKREDLGDLDFTLK